MVPPLNGYRAMARLFELPIAYKNKGIPPRCRNPGAYGVADTAIFSFPEASPDELEPALTFRHRYRTLDTGEEKHSDTVFRQFSGHLVRPVPASSKIGEGMALTTDNLRALAGAYLHDVPKVLRCASSNYHYDYPATTVPASTLKAKHVTSSGRDAAIGEIQASIDENCVLVGDTVYFKAHDPKINVWIRDDEITVDRSLIKSGRYNFPVDRPDLVEEFTDWLRAEYGVNVGEKSWGSYDRGCEFIFDHPNIPLSANPVIEAALDLADRAGLNIVNAEYYGPEVKGLGNAFKAAPTIEAALAFAEEFERAALSGDYPDHEYSGNEREFAIFRKFVEIMPDEYKGDLAHRYSAEISVPLTMPSFVGR